MINLVALDVVFSLTLGFVFAVSAIPKLRNPRGFVLIVLNYRVLPPQLAIICAHLVPSMQLFTAFLLLSGTAVRLAATVVCMLLLAFTVAVAINVARGRDFDCGCFAGKGRIGRGLLLQNLALFAMAVVIGVRAHSWLTLEPWSILQIFPLAAKSAETSLTPLLSCVMLTASAAAILARWSGGRILAVAHWRTVLQRLKGGFI